IPLSALQQRLADPLRGRRRFNLANCNAAVRRVTPVIRLCLAAALTRTPVIYACHLPPFLGAQTCAGDKPLPPAAGAQAIYAPTVEVLYARNHRFGSMPNSW